MRRYNIWRPILLVAVALLTNNLVTTLATLFGMSPDAASNLGYIAMVIAALIAFNRMRKPNRK